MRPALPLHMLSEKQWQAQVIELARTLGWRHYHPLRSKGSPAGWPDLVLCRERLVHLELKTESGSLSPAQRDWIRALHTAGAEVYVARPRHLQTLATVLAARGTDHAEARAALLLELDPILQQAAWARQKGAPS